MLYIVSDYPDKYNEEKPLGDSHGLFFWHLFYKVGLNPRDMEIHYLWPDYKTYAYDRESYSVAKFKKGNNIIVPLGRAAASAFGITESIDKIRGSVMPWNDSWMVPTFHPRNLKSPYRAFSQEPILKGFYCAKDLEKVKQIYDNGWTQIEEKFNIAPDIVEWRSFVKEAVAKQTLLATDIEATGLSLEHAQLVVIGFAINESECMVYPFTDYGGEPYWPEDQVEEADQLLRHLLANGRFLFQNGVGYDVPLLRARGYNLPLENFEHDTMVMHHALDPELPHNIGFINSLYGKMKYWKDSFLNRKEKIHYTDQDAMRTYNARDCINLHQIMPPMMKALTEANLMQIYVKGMEVARPVIDMQSEGLVFSESKYRKWTKYLKNEMYDALEELKDIRELPDEFNLNSAEHKRWLFFRKPIPKAEKAFIMMKEYDLKTQNYQYACNKCERKRSVKIREDERITDSINIRCSKCGQVTSHYRTSKPPTTIKQKSKTSLKYKSMEAVAKVMAVEPFVKVKGYQPLKTDKGDYALDKNEMTRMLQGINRRLESIDNLVRKTETHEEEEQALRVLLRFNLAYQRYATLEKLQSAFGRFPVWQDGRVRPSILVTGTSTGRFSCKSPNLQQLPSGSIGNIVRSCFRSPSGYKLLSVDWLM